MLALFLLLLLVAILALGGLILWVSTSKRLLSDRLRKRREEFLSSITWVTLRLSVPKENEKPPKATELLLASLHGILRDDPVIQEHISLEVEAEEGAIVFYIHCPVHLRDFVESQVYAQYPTVEIVETADPLASVVVAGKSTVGAELLLTNDEVYPIKTFENFDVDPLSAITSVLSRATRDEEIVVQYLVRPVSDAWQKKGFELVKQVKSGSKPADYSAKALLKNVFSLFGEILNSIIFPPKPDAKKGGKEEKKDVKLPGPVEEALGGVETKITSLGYETKIRLISVSLDPATARSRLESALGAFKQFNTLNMNGFKAGEYISDSSEFLDALRQRAFETPGYILNVTELASLWHLPNITVTTPNIVWSGAKKGEPPANLPLVGSSTHSELTVLGETDFRTGKYQFGIKLDDRRRHIYIVGKTGVGKSVLLANMALSDIIGGHGVAVVDPHGELVEEIIRRIPDERIDDVILLDPSDRAYPLAFNPLEAVDDDYKGLVASGFVGIFKKIFGNSWGPRLEHILRNTVLALMDNDHQTMLGIPKMLTDKKYRDEMVKHVKDPVIKDFWINEFAQYDVKFRTEAVSPILNKVGQFLSSATIRNILGQPTSSLDIRKIMDTKKILLINLSRGKIGEDNAALLGAMLVTKVQLAAMSRADIPRERDRVDFFLYVDEFQNFATESFAVILSEARKYRLNLTMANQYINQIEETVRDAVFGNVGTIISFRVGAQDTDFLVKEYDPVFVANDLVNLAKYHIYIKLMIDGVASPAFSAATLPLDEVETGNLDTIKELSRTKYAREQSQVEQDIMDWAMQGVGEPTGPELALQSLKTVLGDGTNLSPVAKSEDQKPPTATTVTTTPENASPAQTVNQPAKGNAADVVNSQQEIDPSTNAANISDRDDKDSIVKKFNPADLVTNQLEAEKSIGKAIIGDLDDKGVARKKFNPADLVTNQLEAEKSIGKAIIGERIYREISAKGGDRWYFGGILTEEEKEKIVKKMTPRKRRDASPEEETEQGSGLTQASGGSTGSSVLRIAPGESAKVEEENQV